MRVLGVDPGLRNIGVVVLEEGKPIHHELVYNDESEGIAAPEVLAYVLPKVVALAGRFKPDIAAVEGVVWQGRKTKIAMPLAQVAGGIAGVLFPLVSAVFLLSPQQKDRKLAPKRLPRGWTDHEVDALLLARKGEKLYTVFTAGGSLDRHCLGAATPTTTTVKPVPGALTKTRRRGKPRA